MPRWMSTVCPPRDGAGAAICDMSEPVGAAAELGADDDAEPLLQPQQNAVAVPLTTAQLLSLHGGLFAALLIWSIMHIVVYVCVL